MARNHPIDDAYRMHVEEEAQERNMLHEQLERQHEQEARRKLRAKTKPPVKKMRRYV